MAAFLASLPDEVRARVSSHAALDLPGDEEGIAAVLAAHAVGSPSSTPLTLLATIGAQAGASEGVCLTRTLERVALDLSRGTEDLQLAHVLLAHTHFRNRLDEADLVKADLVSFVEHCRAAIHAGHAGTFCYERLTVLYECRGEREEVASVCRRAVEVLEAAGDPLSAARFRKRLGRLES